MDIGSCPGSSTCTCTAGEGTVRIVTIAPELAGALDAIHLLVRHGVVAAIGHTDATYEQTRAAIATGATVGTHVFNGMRPPHHRQPGPVFALLASPSVVCEFVADGTHLHDGTLTFATRSEEHTSELQSRENLVCRLLLEKK